jgi:hypothetical protein
VLGDAGDERQHDPQDVRDLGGRVDRELVGGGDRRDDDPARLHRVGDQPLLDVAAVEDDLRGRLGGGVVAAGERPEEALVRPGGRVDQRGAVGEGGLHVENGRQRLVVDVDVLQRVGRDVAVPGHDDGDGVAGVADLVDGDRRVVGVDHVGGDRPGAGQAAELLGEVGAAERGDDTGPLERGRDVDPADPGVRHRAAQDRQVHHAGQGDVVGPVGLAGEQLGVLLAAPAAAQLGRAVRGAQLAGLGDLLGDHAGVEFLGHAMPPASLNAPGFAGSPRISAAAASTDRTMFT